jgi:crotonobetainyl-CoA:carnitine CoA-transferase CaiB-like acyl-CoA transferase
MAGALDGVRVIDFGQYIAGPMTGMLLADQGADVVKVDPPGGPRWDSPANATYNRGKRSIVLDLKDPTDLESARRLIVGADVLVENFRPGVMDRLGLGAEATLAANPSLVYCSIPGFAPDDPRRDVKAWEGVIGAATATYRPAQVPARGEPSRTTGRAQGRPVYTAVPISSTYAAFQAAVSIAMALNARERDGAGQVVQVPIFDGTFAAIGTRGLRVHNSPPGGAEAGMARMMGWTRQFECKDGRWIMFHGGNKNLVDFLAAVGASEWAQQASPETAQKTEALFRTRTAPEWEAFAESVGTECAVCRTSAEWLQNDHARASKIIIETRDPKLGRLLQPGINVRMSKTPGEIRSPAPAPGQHRSEVLSSVPPGLGAGGPIPATSGNGGPNALDATMRSALEGVRVLDLCIVLAGPTCGRTLAEFGADVIKIDSPYRQAVSFHNDINRAKRSILIDLKNPEGLEIFWKLVDTADVVVQNFRRGIAEKLGFGYEAVKARKPDIVYASLNTYGQIGPYANRPGHEQIAQAATGMQERYGGSGRPVLQPFAVNDYGTGFMGAYGVALALLHRKKTGEGQMVDSALAYTATMLQAAFMNDYEGKKWDEPRGQEALGSGPLHRAYECADGWLFLGAASSDLAALEALTGESDYASLSPAQLEARLEARLTSGKVEEWVTRLTAAGIGAHRNVADVAELMEDAWVQSHGLSITRDHDGFGPVTTTGPGPRMSRSAAVPGRPAPRPGSDARSVLADIGLDGKLEELVTRGIVCVDGVTAR